MLSNSNISTDKSETKEIYDKTKSNFFKPISNELKIHQVAEKFIHHVVNGEQDQAQNLLEKEDKTSIVQLLSQKRNVTDPTKREFFSITPFQYALWSKDWYMCNMIMPYLPLEIAKRQFEELEEKGVTYKMAGYKPITETHFDLTPLITALQNFVDQFFSKDLDACENQWCYKVGSEQKSVPVNIANEYCHPYRGFYSTPTFDEDTLPRKLNYIHAYYHKDYYFQGTVKKTYSWYQSEHLGNRCALTRGGAQNYGPYAIYGPNEDPNYWGQKNHRWAMQTQNDHILKPRDPGILTSARSDLIALKALQAKRNEQFIALRENLQITNKTSPGLSPCLK